MLRHKKFDCDRRGHNPRKPVNEGGKRLVATVQSGEAIHDSSDPKESHSQLSTEERAPQSDPHLQSFETIGIQFAENVPSSDIDDLYKSGTQGQGRTTPENWEDRIESASSEDEAPLLLPDNCELGQGRTTPENWEDRIAGLLDDKAGDRHEEATPKPKEKVVLKIQAKFDQGKDETIIEPGVLNDKHEHHWEETTLKPKKPVTEVVPNTHHANLDQPKDGAIVELPSPAPSLTCCPVQKPSSSPAPIPASSPACHPVQKPTSSAASSPSLFKDSESSNATQAPMTQEMSESEFNRLTKVIFDILCPLLRNFFVSLWNKQRNHYGLWEKVKGTDKLAVAIGSNEAFNKLTYDAKNRIAQGNIEDFDPTCLFTVLMHLNLFSLRNKESGALKKLQDVRNKVLHLSSTNMSKPEFDHFFEKISEAFKTLKWDTKELKEICEKRVCFKHEYQRLKQMHEDEKQKWLQYNKQLQKRNFSLESDLEAKDQEINRLKHKLRNLQAENQKLQEGITSLEKEKKADKLHFKLLNEKQIKPAEKIPLFVQSTEHLEYHAFRDFVNSVKPIEPRLVPSFGNEIPNEDESSDNEELIYS